jgi:hypothetical protein
MPENPTPDPISQLESLRPGGLVVNPLPADEVRRRGDRRRRTRRTLTSLAAAAVVMGVVVPVALLNGNGEPAGSPPLVGSPSATPTSSPSSAPAPSSTPTQASPPASAAPPTTITFPGNGLSISDPADVDKLTGTTPAFQAFMADQVRRAQRAGQQCPDATHGVTVQKYSSAGYAYGGYNDCGGYTALWVDHDDSWQEGYGSQDAWDCDTLTYFGIPRSFVGECFDEQSENFGPKTYAGLRLGMTRAQVTAAGSTVRGGSSTSCGSLFLQYQQKVPHQVDGYVSPTKGLVDIAARPGVKTAEGIGLGSSLQKVRAAYPDAVINDVSGILVPHGDGTELQITVDRKNIVQTMSLRTIDQDCFD